MDYSPQFQTFGRAPDSSKSFSRNSSFTQSKSRAPDLTSGYSSRTLDSSKPIIQRQNLHPSLARSSSNGLNLGELKIKVKQLILDIQKLRTFKKKSA